MTKIFIILLVIGLGRGIAQAACTISSSAPTANEAGEVMRNPVQGAQSGISVQISVNCSESNVEIQAITTQAAFQNILNPTVAIPYKLSVVGINGGIGANLTAPTPGMPMLLGETGSSGTTTFTLFLTPNAIVNLQAGTFSDTVTIITSSMSGSEQSSFSVSGIVPDDCQISLGGPPDSIELGNILKSPSLDSFAVPVSVECKTYKASISMKALNGHFKGSANNSTVVPYSVSVHGPTMESNQLNSGSMTGVWVSAGTILVNTATSASLIITPGLVAALPPDTYTETVYIRVNGP